jgi:hypothetical protein
MEVEEIKAKLEARGYYISPNYGLILENKNDELVIADIRKCEKLIVLPHHNEVETKEARNLIGILGEEIPFRNKPRNG